MTRRKRWRVSDRIVVMDKGRIAQVGTPEDLYERPASAFIANFIGDANLIEGRVAAGRFTAEGLDRAAAGRRRARLGLDPPRADRPRCLRGRPRPGRRRRPISAAAWNMR